MDEYTVVLYARVSTDDKGQTNENQIRELKEYVKRNGYIIADHGEAIYTDEQTGKNDKRPGFRQLKGRITEGDIDYVLARNQDRISREPGDYQDFLNFCKQFRVRVRFSDNASEPETAGGVLVDSLYAGLAKADNIKRSMATKAGMQTAKLNGIHCGRYLAFCFTNDVEKNRARIQTSGKYRTVIMSENSVLDMARNGLTVAKAAKFLGISRMTLDRALHAHGLFDEYEKLRTQGKRQTRVGEPDESTHTREQGEDAQ